MKPIKPEIPTLRSCKPSSNRRCPKGQQRQREQMTSKQETTTVSAGSGSFCVPRAAIDALLDSKASVYEICTYLVLARFFHHLHHCLTLYRLQYAGLESLQTELVSARHLASPPCNSRRCWRPPPSMPCPMILCGHYASLSAHLLSWQCSRHGALCIACYGNPRRKHGVHCRGARSHHQ